MVNVEALKAQVCKAPPNMPNGGEVWKYIFEQKPDLRKYWDMEDIEPEQIAKSRQMQQKGASFLSSLSHLVNNVDNEKAFRQEMCELRDTYKEMGFSVADSKKLLPGVICFYEKKLGKLTDAQKMAWSEFFDKFSAGLKEAGLS